MNRKSFFRTLLSFVIAVSLLFGYSAPSFAAKAKQNVTISKSSPIYKELTQNGMFDYEYYMANNPDVVAVLGTSKTALLNHFLNYGIYECRQPNPDFNINAYSSAYADLKAAFNGKAEEKQTILNYYNHYARYGKKEGRNITSLEAAANAGITVSRVASDEVIRAEVLPAVSVAPSVMAAPTPAPYQAPAPTPSPSPAQETDPSDQTPRISFSSSDNSIYHATDYCYFETEHFIVLLSKDTYIPAYLGRYLEICRDNIKAVGLDFYPNGYTNKVTAKDIAFCDFSGTDAFDNVNLGNKYPIVINSMADNELKKHDEIQTYTTHTKSDGQKTGDHDYMLFTSCMYSSDEINSFDNYYYLTWRSDDGLISSNLNFNTFPIAILSLSAIERDDGILDLSNFITPKENAHYGCYFEFVNTLLMFTQLQSYYEITQISTAEYISNCNTPGYFLEDCESTFDGLTPENAEQQVKDIFTNNAYCGDGHILIDLFALYLYDTYPKNEILPKLIAQIEAHPSSTCFDDDTYLNIYKEAYGDDFFTNFVTWLNQNK